DHGFDGRGVAVARDRGVEGGIDDEGAAAATADDRTRHAAFARRGVTSRRRRVDVGGVARVLMDPGDRGTTRVAGDRAGGEGTRDQSCYYGNGEPKRRTKHAHGRASVGVARTLPPELVAVSTEIVRRR